MHLGATPSAKTIPWFAQALSADTLKYKIAYSTIYMRLSRLSISFKSVMFYNSIYKHHYSIFPNFMAMWLSIGSSQELDLPLLLPPEVSPSTLRVRKGPQTHEVRPFREGSPKLASLQIYGPACRPGEPAAVGGCEMKWRLRLTHTEATHWLFISGHLRMHPAFLSPLPGALYLIDEHQVRLIYIYSV